MAISTSELSLLQQNIIVLPWLIIPVFVGVGVLNIFSKPIHPVSQHTLKESSQGLLSGFLLPLLNFQLLPFWFSVIAFLNNYGLMHTHSLLSKIFLATGAAVGAFCLLIDVSCISCKPKQ